MIFSDNQYNSNNWSESMLWALPQFNLWHETVGWYVADLDDALQEFT